MAKKEKDDEREDDKTSRRDVSFGDYVDMSPDERAEFHRSQFRKSARFERRLLGEESKIGSKHLALGALLLGAVGVGAYLIYRASQNEGTAPAPSLTPVADDFSSFIPKGPLLAAVVGGGIGAGFGLALGSSALKMGAVGAGIGVVGALLNPPPEHHAHRRAARAKPTPSQQPATAPKKVGYYAGAQSTDVFHAQYRLGQLGYPVIADGVLGPTTVEALKRFQSTYSLQRQDGSVNPETLAYLDMVVKQSAGAADPSTGLHSSFSMQT